jgi:MFS family permease
MGQATAFWQLAALTAFVWFFVGIGFTSLNILAGLSAGEAERGKIFGILAINTSLGALVGGFVSGPIVERWGYPVWFLVAALCWVLQPAIGLLLQDKVVVRAQREAVPAASSQPGFRNAFYLLLLANVLAFAASFVAVLGRPLLMDRLGFDLAAISGAVAVGGAVTLPFPLVLGWLSDRLGRYWLIMLCFFAGAVGLALLAVSVSLWHFWAASIFLAGVGVSLGIGPALITDLVPEESLGTALAWYGFAPSTGGIIGFMLTGYAIEIFGMATTFVAGAAFTLIAIALVVQVRRVQQLALA